MVVGENLMYFANPEGYVLKKIRNERRLFFPDKAIYRFTLDQGSPLTFCANSGADYQPNRQYETDMGSIPLFLQWRIQKDRFLLSFLFHDSAWTHGGMWVRNKYSEEFRFVDMSRWQSNMLLSSMVRCEGATRRELGYIMAGVSIGAAWKGLHSEPFPKGRASE